uniref:Uncharacterized protein n=1 Tax=Siphoviridae sp. ctHOG1 TaxID=2827829 RepID=A0A8S5SWA9_9CAUD|nr:MAG TPA: hypothetical protein [Siphoviridae sp. ctHOG1]
MIISPFPLDFVKFVVYLQCSTLIHRQTDVCKSRHFFCLLTLLYIQYRYIGCLIPWELLMHSRLPMCMLNDGP